jgi:uncharacterized protein (TIGR02285 family)
LSRLLDDQKVLLGISNGRKYSGGIDEILNRHQGSDNILVRSGEDVFNGLLTMLFYGRIDCVIGYPIEAKYFAGKPSDFDGLEIYMIAENKIEYTLGHVGCPKNKWGESIIQSVNKVLLDHRQTDEYLQFYEYWLDKQTVHIYRDIVDRYFWYS